jgi:hypothetical protein
MPKTLTSKTPRHSSSGLSSMVPWAPIPALLTRMVDAAEAPRSLLDGRPYARAVGHVGVDAGERFGHVVRLQVEACDTGPSGGEQSRRGQPDAGGAAGDDRRQAGRLG